MAVTPARQPDPYSQPIEAYDREAAGIDLDEDAHAATQPTGAAALWGMLAVLVAGALWFGYLLGGLAFLTGLTQAVLVLGALYLTIDIYREWKRDRIFWGAIREYLARHDGRDKYDGR